jgi:hypothetical protein
VLYLLAPLGAGVDPAGPASKWWGLAVLALPLVTGFLAARWPAAPGAGPAALSPAGRGVLVAGCALAATALLLSVLTLVTIALFPHHVPLQLPPPPAGGGCETCDPNQVVIPPGLRREYWTELSVGQAGMTPLMMLMIAPFLGAWLGVLGAGLARISPGARRRGTGGPPAGPAGHAVTWSASGLIVLALGAVTVAVPSPTPADDSHAGPILFLVTVAGLIAWLAVGAHLLGTWHQQRRRRRAGPLLSRWPAR